MAAVELPPTLGLVAADWVERFCHHGPGDMQGRPVRLTDEAVRFLCDAYELEASGRRRVRRAMLVRPKGWSKSELAAFVALFEALGPARCAGFDGDGEPVAVPVPVPVVRIVATEENQTGNIYDNIYYNLTEGPLAATQGIDVGLTRINLPNGGNIKPVSAGSASKDGGKESHVQFDELHLFTLPELHRLHATYLRNLRKRKAAEPWSLETTTAYRPGERSVAETAMQYAEKIAAGEVIDGGFLYDHLRPPAGLDLDDPEQRMRALRAAYGDADWLDFEQICRDYDDPTTDRVDWRRYFCSEVVVAADSFLDPQEWAACADATLALHDGDAVCIGIDTSLVDDGTAVVAARVSDGYIQRLGYWQKPDGRAGVGWQVPFGEVDACVRAAFDRYRVLRVYCDPQYAHGLLDDWSLRFGAKKIYSWPTNRAIPMSAALERLFVAVRTGDLKHDGDSLLALHAGNARTWRSQGRTLIRKAHPHSPDKIDLIVAATLAMEAAADAHTAGEDAEPAAPARRRVWSMR